MSRAEAKSGGIVLGIDPGSRNCGYGLLDSNGAYIASGTIMMTPTAPLSKRLGELFEGLNQVICETKPACAVVERMFFAKSVRSALSLGHARGVAVLSAERAGLEIFEYSALQVKKAVVGYGRAEKHQVQMMIKSILSLDFLPSTDGADALALAMCHLNMAVHNR